MRVLVIGGGASGMMAALTASECAENEVYLIERQSRMARKLLATGNGRCNLTNLHLSEDNYHGEQRAFCNTALREFDVKETLRYFRSLGLLTMAEESGRVYPYSNSANSVADVLRLALEQRENVHLHTACEITALRRRKGIFYAESEENCFDAERVIVCAGGAAGGKLGGTDWGYRLLMGFGHSRTKLYPSLVQIRTDSTYVRALKGIRCDARASFSCGRIYAECCGEIQFTDYGVSGPAIFELSRMASSTEGGTLRLDLMREVEEAELYALLLARREALPQVKLEDFLTGMLHNRLGRTLLRSCGYSLEQHCGTLDDASLRQICHAVKNFELLVLGTMGMEQAQVTAGGIRTSEFCAETLESRLCPGLYAAGEVLDIDGDCGGYNLQWAWSSGRLAGQLK